MKGRAGEVAGEATGNTTGVQSIGRYRASREVASGGPDRGNRAKDMNTDGAV